MAKGNRISRSRAHDFSALSTSIGVALTLILMGALLAGAMLLRQIRSDWMSAMRVQVVLSEVPGTAEEVDDWVALFEGKQGVAEVQYLNPVDAAAELEQELGEPFMEFLGTSPLPGVLELKLDREWMAQSGLDGLQTAVGGWSGVAGVARIEYPKSLLARMESGFDGWTTPGLAVLAVLVLIVFAQISNVVRLSVFGRRFLIRSMELVGAPPRRIRRPFVAEAMGYGFVGALLAYACVVFVLGAGKPLLPDTLGHWGFRELGLILGVQLLVGLALTGLTARWAVKRFCGERLDRLV